MAIQNLLQRHLQLAVCSIVLLIGIRGAIASSCPGDFNNDGSVTIDELVLAVNAALNGCAAVRSQSTILQTGQTQCDQGTETLGTCPGSPAGQDGLVRAGVPLSYSDNGDGTIVNIASGLTWEKLSADGGIHDVNTTYAWNDAFAVKIAALNTAPCFAGFCDWRLPNRRELDSLVDAGQVAPAIDPVFSASCTPGCAPESCSCTQLDYYWSSTTYQDLPDFAWAVDGNVGIINAFDKSTAYNVRAVRGGL